VEGYDGANGWGFGGDEDHDHFSQDQRDADELYRLIEDEVSPMFYARDEHGLPREWLARVKTSLRTLGPQFCAGRMLRDYDERLYRAAVPTL
jgi:starch phosphorylase